ncbi:MAG: hypothetical protein U0528_07695 [Anaerolineae bacterium]
MFFWNMVANKPATLTNILYNCILSDMETCYKVFRAEVVRWIDAAFASLIRAGDHGESVEAPLPHLRVPISYNGREWTEGKKDQSGRLSPIAKAWTLLRYRFTD